ncbi:PIN domain-containing protein [Candidatus Woesearchaeota archaeon]|nr:PIN domain-containing protein [Candidatus Woesearchaeota archaeon]
MYFFDTYAIFELINGNPAYDRFADETIVTSVLNIGELYYGLLKDHGKAAADLWMHRLNPDLVEIDTDAMLWAMTFRFAHMKLKLSMVDCIGYALAHKIGVRFLTGDKGFEGLPNVEYVK